jgi:hypothetical protein
MTDGLRMELNLRWRQVSLSCEGLKKLVVEGLVVDREGAARDFHYSDCEGPLKLAL